MKNQYLSKKLILKALTCMSITTASVMQTSMAQDSVPLLEKSLVETAAESAQFTILSKALKAANLTTVLEAEGPFTVFAPTDEAFSKLPAGMLEDLLKPENKRALVNILKYHVVKGKVTARVASTLDKAKSITGETIRISANGQVLKIKDSNVVTKDIGTINGIIHGIDEVLIPAADDPEVSLSGDTGIRVAKRALEIGNKILAEPRYPDLPVGSIDGARFTSTLERTIQLYEIASRAVIRTATKQFYRSSLEELEIALGAALTAESPEIKLENLEKVLRLYLDACVNTQFKRGFKDDQTATYLIDLIRKTPGILVRKEVVELAFDTMSRRQK